MTVNTKQSVTLKIPKLRFPGFSGEWEEKKLGDMLSMTVDNRGKTPLIELSGIPLLEVNSLGKKFVEYSKVKKYVNEETYENWFRKHLQPNDILFSTVGATAICSFYQGENKATIAQNIVGLRFRDEDSNFMYYLLTEKKNNHQFKRIEMGAVQPSVKVSQMIKIKFLLPALPEQQKISDFFGLVDKWIENLRLQKESLEAYKKGMMQKIFSQEIRFKDGNMCDFPDWEEKMLVEVLKTISTRPHQIKNSNINRQGRFKVIDQGQKEIAGYTNEQEKLFKNDEAIVYGDHTTVIKYIDFDFVVGADGTKLLKKQENNNLKYLFYNLSFNNIKSEGYKRHFSILKNINLQIPTLSEQQKIADFLTSIDNFIEAKQAEIIKVEKWKKGLMQQLFV